MPYPRLRHARWILAACLLATPALADEGRLEINQTCAVETGCFAGDLPGFPVRISASGSYVLTGPLDVDSAKTSAVEIATSDVALDLNGFTIEGPYLCGSTPPTCDPEGDAAPGIDGSGASSAWVHSGTVRQFGGPLIQLYFYGRVEDVHVSRGGGSGIEVGGGGVVRNCTVTAIRERGIWVHIGATTTDGLIEGNLLRSVTGDEIEVGSTSLVLRNRLGGTGAFGPSVGYSQNHFTVAPAGGVSAGDNFCNGASC